MFTIGEFARLGHVTVRTLRHYDTIGLLHPQSVDEATGYRLYAAAQLPRLNRIVALQRLGFSLSELEHMLGTITADQMRGMLALRRSQVQDELAAQESALREIDARLQSIEREGAMPDFELTLKPLPALHFAAVSSPVPGFGPENVTEPMMAAAKVVEASLAASNVLATDPWFLCFSKASDEDITAYFCKPIPEHVVSLEGDAGVFTLDAVPHAISVVRHLDDLDGYSDIYHEMALWAEANGFEVVGDGRDLALDDAGTVMDTQLPLRRLGEAAPNVTPRRVTAR